MLAYYKRTILQENKSRGGFAAANRWAHIRRGGRRFDNSS